MKKWLRQMREIASFANAAKNGVSQYVGDGRVLTLLYSGNILLVDGRDVSLAPHLVIRGEWELGYSQYFRRLVKPTSNVLDCGANFGYYGVLAGNDNPRGTVTFIEANPFFSDFLKANIHMNGLAGRSHVEIAAAAESSGETLTLHVPEMLLGSARVGGAEVRDSFSSGYGLDSRSSSTPSVSIDELSSELAIDFDLIKLDIEGSEEAALNGSINLIERVPSLDVFMEFSFGGPGRPLGAYSPNFWGFMASHFRELRLVFPDGRSKVVHDLDELAQLPSDTTFAMLHLKK